MAFAEQRQIPDEIALASPDVHMITRMYALRRVRALPRCERARSGRIRRHSAIGSARRVHLALSAAREERVVDGTSRDGASMAGRSRGAPPMLTRSAVPAAWCCPSSRWPPPGAGRGIGGRRRRRRRSVAAVRVLALRAELGPAWALAAQGNLPGRGPRCRPRPTSRACGWLPRLGGVALARHRAVSAIPSRSPTVSRSSASCVRARSCRRTRCTQLPPYPAAVRRCSRRRMRFEQLGALLFAAEATAEAARAFRRQGDAADGGLVCRAGRVPGRGM